MVYISPCLDSCVVNGRLRKRPPGVLSRGPVRGCAVTHRGVDGRSVGTPPAWWMRHRYSWTCSFIRRSASSSTFRRVGVFGYPLHPGGSGFGRGETGLSRRSGSERMLSRLRPAGWAVAIVGSCRKTKSTPFGVQPVKSIVYYDIGIEQSVYMAPLRGSTWQSPPTGGQWVAQP
jgi:hypothetical protein